MTFEEWLQEIEVFSTRLERCKSDIASDGSYIEDWLRAAFDAGFEAGWDESKELYQHVYDGR